MPRSRPGSLSDLGMRYYETSDFGRIGRSSWSNSDGYFPRTTGQSASNPLLLAARTLSPTGCRERSSDHG